MSAILTSIDYDRLSYMAQRPSYRGVHSEQITALAQHIQSSKVIPADKTPRNLVTMNSRIKARDVETGEVEAYTIVYPESADIQTGRISALSPLGRALLGRRVGQTVEVVAPIGVRTIKIDRILYQPEAAGHFEL
jgi:regulator of nucleoside diphosphate kinase